VTTIDVNPAPRRLRSALVRLLFDFASRKGLQPVDPYRSKPKDGSKKGRAKKVSLPRFDVEWLHRGRALWKFRFLPTVRELRQLDPESRLPDKIIICADASNNLGVIEPAGLLDFLEKSGAAADTNAIHSLARHFTGAPIAAQTFHFKGAVTKNHHFLKDHYSLRIRTGFVPKPAPGQFLQLLCDPAAHAEDPKYRRHSYGGRQWPKLKGAELIAKRPFLRRPFSIASYGPPTPRDELKDTRRLGPGWLDLVNWLESEFEVIYRRVPGGPGTGALADHGVGDKIDVVGPLGRGFNLAPPPEVALLVGGGIGATPMPFLAHELVRRGVEVILFIGAITTSRIPFRLHGTPKHRIPRIPMFERLGIKTIVCTDDGSAGKRMLVTEPLEKYLEKNAPASAKIYACGPRPMLAALEGIANHHGVPCEVLLEERMACGFGACISCVCGVKESGEKTHFTRICTEGPAFDVKKVMWHA